MRVWKRADGLSNCSKKPTMEEYRITGGLPRAFQAVTSGVKSTGRVQSMLLNRQ